MVIKQDMKRNKAVTFEDYVKFGCIISVAIFANFSFLTI